MNSLRRLAPALLLALILHPHTYLSIQAPVDMNTLGTVYQAGSGWWYGTIIIREDGSVYPANAPVVRQDNTYTLTKNVKSDGDGIVIRRDNIVLDGAGYTVEGSNKVYSKGVDLTSRTKVTVRNLNIRNFYFGIYLNGSSGNIIVSNIVSNNGSWTGIHLYRSSSNTIIGNNIGNNRDGSIRLYLSSSNTIIGNNIGNNLAGIGLDLSSSNTIIGNNIGNNLAGIGLDRSSSNTIIGNNIGNNRDGIGLWNSSYNLIYNNVFANDVNAVIKGTYVNYWSIEKTPGTNIVGGPYLGGNYWSGFSETCPDSDGDLICDWPYVIDVNNIDYYPLAKPEHIGRPPSVPVGLWGYYNGSVVLVWYPSGDGVDGYRVYRGSGTGDYVLIGEFSASISDYYVFVDNSIERGRVYSYRVVAFNEYGESDPAPISVATSKYIGLDVKDHKISPGRGYGFTLKILDESLIRKPGIIIETIVANGSITPSKIENPNTLYYTLKYYPPVYISPDEDTIAIHVYEKGVKIGRIVFSLHVSNDVATTLEHATLWDHWRDTYSFLNIRVNWSRGGVCYGIAETELLYFMRYVLGYTGYPSFPSNPPNATKTRDLEAGNFDGGELNNVTFAIVLHQLYGLQLWEYFWKKVRLGTGLVDLKQEFSELTGYLSKGKPVILGLGPDNKHAVVAWRVDRGSDDKYYIYISDPNRPDQVNYAIYDPRENKFYYSALYYWDKFIVMEAKPLSFHDITWSISGIKQMWMKNYIFIIANRNISIKDSENPGSVSHFLKMSDSSSFRSSIPGVAGVSERDFVAFAVPWNKRVKIDPEGYSSILIFWANSTELGVEVYGYWFNVTSDTGYAIVPLRDGFNITVSDNTVVLNITVFSYINDSVNVFNAYNIVLNPSTEALFAITDWSALNTTEKPVINLKAYNATNKQYIGEAQIYNRQTGVGIVAETPTPSPSIPSLPSLTTYVVGALVAVVVLIAVFALKKKHG